MNARSQTLPLFWIGNDEPRGSYVLRIHVKKASALRFGRFKRGKLIDVEPGNHLYIGSAMALQGATCLARRLVRHATRSGNKKPHAVRAAMLSEFPIVGIADSNLRAPATKTLKWNVDYLLDTPAADLISAYIVRCPLSLESNIGDMLENDPHTIAFEKGLGANDRPGSTYLLRVDADEDWWYKLAHRLDALRARAMNKVWK